MDTEIVDLPDENRFAVLVDGRRVGFLAYERAGDVVTFTRIETDSDLAGQGIGLVLVRGALDAVSREGLSVRPVCPFVRDFIGRHPVYLDLVAPDERADFELPPPPAP
jgi:predicted GNAT family acetyltransferase